MVDKMTKIFRNIVAHFHSELDGVRERYPDWSVSTTDWVDGEIVVTMVPKKYDENGNEMLVNGYDKGYGYSDE